VKETGKKLSLHRIEALTDGIFAIAMTIMVLNINVPQSFEIKNAGDLSAALFNMWPVFLDYAISFMLLASLWIETNVHFDFLRHTDRRYLTFNLIRLMLITLIPFSTALMTKYSGMIVAELFFHLNYFLIKFMTVINWGYIKKNEQLIHPDKKDMDVVKDSISLNLILSVVPIIAICFTFVNPDWSNIVYICIPFITAIIRKKREKNHSI